MKTKYFMQLHDDLSKKFGWYKTWHQNSYYPQIHWVIVLLFAFYTVSAALNLVHSSQLQVALNTSEAKTIQNKYVQLSNLTTQLLNDANSENITDIQSVAKSRRSAILAAIKSHPQDALSVALDDKTKKKLPKEIQADLEQTTEVSGTLEIYHTDDFAGDKGTYDYNLKTNSGKKYQLHFTDVGPDGVLMDDSITTGTKLKVHGLAVDDQIAVDNSKGSSDLTVTANVKGASIEAGQVKGAINKTIGILLYSNRSLASVPSSVETTNTAFFGPSGSIASFYNQQSYGKMVMTGKVFGPYYSSDACNNLGGIIAQAAANGFADYNFTNVVYFNDCPGNSNAIVGGKYSTVHGLDQAAHELGHNFGLNHSHSFKCVDENGQPVAFTKYGAGCTYDEYGDPFSLMGSGRDHQNDHKEKMGFYDANNIKHVWTDGTYVISQGDNPSTGVQQLHVDLGPQVNTTYFGQPVTYYQDYYQLEYRPSQAAGVMFRYGTDYLIDTTPGDTAAFGNAYLTLGRTYNDPYTGIIVKLLSLTPDAATIQLTYGASTCVHAAPLISLTPTVQWAQSNQSLNYTLKIQNADSIACAASNFSITPSLPAGFSQSTSQPTVSLAPQAYTSVPFTVSSGSAGVGLYQFSETVANTSVAGYQSSSKANYNIGSVFESVWFDDVYPGGIYPQGGTDWVDSNPASFSGQLSHTATSGSQHGFTLGGSGTPINISSGDVLIQYVYLNPSNPPKGIGLEFNEWGGPTNYRAYWGDGTGISGTDGTASKYNMGPLPATGKWVRLQIPASVLGLEGKQEAGILFDAIGGQAFWDYSAKMPSNGATPPPPPGPTPPPAPNPPPPPPAKSHIILNPTSFNFSGTSGAVAPASQNLSISNTGTATLNWTASLNQSWCHASPTTGSAAPSSASNTSISVDAPTNVGTFSCTLTITDTNADNNPQTAGITYTVAAPVDTTAPTTTITEPANNSSVSGLVNVNAVASDNVGVIKVELYANNSLIGVDTASPYSFSLNTTTYGNSQIALQTKAYDAANNVGASAVVTVTANNLKANIDLSPKSFSFSIASGATAPGAQTLTITNSTVVNLNWSASTNQSWCRVSPTSGTTTANSSSNISVSVDALTTIGTNNCTITVTDPNAGNSPQTASVTYAITNPIDTTLPVTTITSPASNASVSGTINVSANASDNVGVTKVEFYVDGTLIGIITQAPYIHPWTTSGNGPSTITTKAYDAAGNVGASAPISVNRNNLTASLSLSPTTLNFTGISGGAIPAAQTLTVKDTGTLALNWTASKDQSWCNVSPSSGTVGAGSTANLSVSVTGPTNIGTFNCVVTVSASGASNGPQSAAVTYTVAPPPPGTISLNPAALSFNAISGGSTPAPQTSTLTNTGSGTLNWTASKDQGWCNVSPSSGSLSSGTKVTLAVSVTPPTNTGSFACVISIQDPNATNSPQAVTATYTVTAPPPPPPPTAPTISLSSQNLSFAATAGQAAPLAQTVTLTNTGTATLNEAASLNQNWCHINPLTKSIAALGNSILSVSVDAPSNVGIFTCVITIADPNATNSPQAITVTYNVSAAPSGHIEVTPSFIQFNGISGGATPAASSVSLSNSGEGTLNWSANSNQSWCHINPAAGTLLTNTETLLAVSVDAPSNVGTFSCSITVTDPNADNSPVNMVVIYTVSPQPNQTDTTPPAITIVTPANGSTVSGAKVYVTANAADGSGVGNIEIVIDGTEAKTCANVTSCTYSWNAARISKGEHTITVNATDKSPAKNTATATITVKR